MKPRHPYRRQIVLFVLLSVLAIAQLAWWIVFQVGEGARTGRQQRAIWDQQINIARHWATQHALDPAAFQDWLRTAFPDLYLNDAGRVTVTAEAVARLDRISGRRMRMFVSEGLFFTLLMAAGVAYVFWTLRREIDVERRHAVFLLATSHELKTPITSLRLYLDTLQNRDLPPPQRAELLTTMQRDVERLTGQIDRLLQTQSLLDRRRKPALEITDVTEETAVAVEYVRGRFDLSGFDLRVRLQPGVKALTEPQRWQLVVTNLLENAFKYSPGGGTIDVMLDTHREHARLTVTDQGIGLERSQLERIFEQFYRVGSEDTRRTRGTGLGLFLVRRIVESFGGRCRAASRGLGQGAAFEVEIPLIRESV